MTGGTPMTKGNHPLARTWSFCDLLKPRSRIPVSAARCSYSLKPCPRWVGHPFHHSYDGPAVKLVPITGHACHCQLTSYYGHVHIGQMSGGPQGAPLPASLQTVQPEAAAQQGCVPAALRLRQAGESSAVMGCEIATNWDDPRGKAGCPSLPLPPLWTRPALWWLEASTFPRKWPWPVARLGLTLPTLVDDHWCRNAWITRGGLGYLSFMYFSICWAFLHSLICVHATFSLLLRRMSPLPLSMSPRPPRFRSCRLLAGSRRMQGCAHELSSLEPNAANALSSPLQPF